MATLEEPQARLGPGETGKICVRGLPVFPGYLTKAGLDREGFNNAGWFDTGDMGYLDHNGCLFITGRSKEVINRGGEIISPSEVEEAILTAAKDRDTSIYGKVTSVLAFSVPHKSLQEVVGAVIISTPGEPRVDLRQLHHALRQRLDQPKWPVFLVYMDHLPMSHTKALRSNLSHRLHLKSLSDNTPIADRHYEATAPAVGVAITTAIENRQCNIDPEILRTYITQYSGSSQVFIRKRFTDGLLQAFIFDVSTNMPTVEGILSHLCANLPGYLVPTSIKLLNGPIPIDATGSVNEEAINEAIMKPGADEAKDSIYIRVCDIFARTLSLSLDEMDKSTDFFLAGGDSLQSGRMAFELRKEFGIRLPSDVLFINSTVEAMVAIVEKAIITQNTTKSQPSQPPLPSCNETYSSTNPIVLLAQLLPITVFYPVKVAFHWTLFVHLLGEASGHVHTRPNVVTRTAMMTLAWAFAHLATNFVFPLLGIFFKLTVIGRYREGTYPMWGPYHTRWWLVQKALSIWGMGVFDKASWSKRLYLQCMGMKIGQNVSIHPGAQLGEYDLLEIGDNVVLDNCVCRAFAVAHNTSIYLGRIQIERDCSVGLRSIVAPGAHLPPRTYIGPRSSSWAKADATEENDRLMSTRSPHPHWIWNFLIVKPLGTLCTLSMHLPWIAGLVPLANRLTMLESGNKVLNATSWLIEPSHMTLFLRAQVYATIVGPIVKFMFILGIKKTLDLLCGRSVPGPVEIQSRGQILRTAVLSQILPDGHLLWFTELLGVHYELVSIALRALGARIGKRVYWPALGPFTQDYDLVEIGDDVLWGAQSHLNTSDGYGKDKVVIQDGAMVADRAIISPGVSVGERVQVGSGALLKRDKHYSADSVLIGSRQGEAVQFPSPVVKKKDADGVSEILSTPFGRAFYLGLANYRVWTESEIVCYTIAIMAVVSVYWSTGPVISLSILLRIIPAIREHFFDASTTAGWQFVIFSSTLAGLMSLVGGLQSFVALVVVISSKWMLLGQRQPGPHPWDKDSFFQLQQLQLAIEKIMGKAYDGAGILGFFTGTEYLNTFFRALGDRIGRNCALFANGRPTIMLTEPDLVTIGDRVAVDDTSVVAHINTRGEFELRELNIGSGCVLRTASRLMSGASMGDDACLLEHTCILPGDHVDNGAIYQGWPAVPFEAVHDTPSS
ncbi:hypothetical protein N7499_010473 [Penicillium canescens]|nr:hypothetical protein N7499_010473 [Penicillium canescens]KAJ6183361.1 hypothetical protein N7485_002003 [Penicillium canescens]